MVYRERLPSNESDVKVGKLMKAFSPDGFKLTRFEGLARNPLRVVNELYTGLQESKC